MLRLVVLFFALACALFIPAFGQPAPLVKDTAPIQLFNGHNFEGLHIYAESPADPAVGWKIEDGILRCLGGGKGYVRTTTAYADYRLQLEWRWPAKPANSGVLINIVGRDLVWPKCIEAQLASGRAGDFATFSDARSKEEIVSRNPSGVSTGRLNRAAGVPVEKAPGEWNSYEIVVSGDIITATVNGVLVNRMTGVIPSAGMIAFQSEGAAIDFRNIELTPLPAAKDLNQPMPRAADSAAALSAAPNTTMSPSGPATPAPRNRGAPATAADFAEMAKLFELPLFTPGAGDGDYLLKPPYTPAPEQTLRAEVPKGKVVQFTLTAADSKFYPDTGLRGATPTRGVTVYIPSQYVTGRPVALLVTHDAMGTRNNQLPTILDNMIADHRLPPIVAVMITSGGGDGRGSERGLEYDTVSPKFADFIEAEVLPRVEKDYNVTFTKDPEGRATMGGSSGGAVAFTMAWFRPELYRRVLTYSGTYTNNQSPVNPETLHGAWEYHEHLIPENPPKPLRIWMQVGENDNGSKASAADLHNWVIANQRMAGVLKAKGYHYQFVYSAGAGHVDGKVVAQTLPQALEWLWRDYKPVK
jgi:iron(III)-enterobactin esterase